MLKQIDLFMSLSGSKKEEVCNSTRQLTKKYSPNIDQNSLKNGYQILRVILLLALNVL